MGNVRHILALSGGKDSSALAVFMKDRVPEMEYVFCDTEKELDETYEYLHRLSMYLGKPIHTLKYKQGYGFDAILQLKRGYLPSPQARWCTECLKLIPYEEYIGSDEVISYVGIRADEPHRKGYISSKPNIKTIFPFVEHNIRRADVFKILQESGLGVPSYYEWRSRSGCFFCFFQQRIEWVGLLERHPDLFKKAMEYEKTDPLTGEHFTWVQNESLEELAMPERVAAIKANYEKQKACQAKVSAHLGLKDVFLEDVESGETACLMCHL
jgi:3'-phosphoadenosine 5'-phosphosulfate sulfotransferase (PAPS reductase)/FAD synthetase